MAAGSPAPSAARSREIPLPGTDLSVKGLVWTVGPVAPLGGPMYSIQNHVKLFKNSGFRLLALQMTSLQEAPFMGSSPGLP